MAKVVKNNGGNSRLAWGVNRPVGASFKEAFAAAKAARAARNRRNHEAAVARQHAVSGGAGAIAPWFIAGIESRVREALEAMGYPVVKKSMTGFKLDLQLFAEKKTDYPFFSERDRLVFMGDGSRVRNGAFWEATKAERENAREEWRNAMLSGIGSRIRGSAMVVAVDDCYEQAITRDDLMAGVFSRTKAKAMKVAIDAEYDATHEERCQKRMLQLLKKELRRRKFEDRFMPSDFEGDWMAIRTEAKKAGKVLVETDQDFQEFLHRAMKREARSYYVTGLFFDGEGKATPITEMVTANPEVLELEKHQLIAPATVRVGEDSYGEIDRYSYAFLNLHATDLASVKLVENGACTVCRVIEKVNGVTVEERFYIRLDKDHFHDLLTGEEVDRKEVVSRRCADAEYVMLRYDAVASTSSPGQEKQGAITLSCQNIPGWDAWEHHNLMMHGAPKQLLKYYDGKEIAMKQLAQLATRMAQSKPIVKEFAPMSGFCVVLAKIKDDKGNEYEDGYMRLAAEYLADILSDDDYAVMPWAVDGQTCQCRPFVVDKGLGMASPRKHSRQWLEEHHVAVRVVARDELTEEVQDAFNEAVIDKEGFLMLTDDEKAAGYKMAAVLFVESKEGLTNEELLGKLDVLVDLNVCKTTFDLSMPMSGLNVLSFCHGKTDLEDEANTSNQLLQTALVANPYATIDWYVRKSGAEFEDIMFDCLCGKAKHVSPGELEGDLSLVAQKVNPEFVREVWVPYFQDILRKRLHGWTGRNERVCAPIDGIYTKIVPDFGHECGIDLLHYDPVTGECEILAPMLLNRKIRRAIGVKYPKMGHDEYGKFVAVTVEELIERILKFFNEGTITETQRDRLIHQVKAFKTGSVMVPAVEALKNMLAGMDFDGDALILYTDEELVDIVWDEIMPLAVIIMSDEEYREEMKKKAAAAKVTAA